MPGHNAVYVLFGCLLALVGWLAWNVAGAILWLHALHSPRWCRLTAINTLLSASAALGCHLHLVTRIPLRQARRQPLRQRLAGRTGCFQRLRRHCVSRRLAPPCFVGLVAGIGTPLLVELLELALSIDDPSGAITVHGRRAFGAFVAAGLFAPQPGQLLAQLVGIATLLGFVFPLVYLLFWAAQPARSLPRGRRTASAMGMDLHELGGGAYPEFVIHRDESYR
jgi:ammonium transporter, Amt family